MKLQRMQNWLLETKDKEQQIAPPRSHFPRASFFNNLVDLLRFDNNPC